MNNKIKETDSFEFQIDNVVSLPKKLEKMDFLTIEEVLEKYPNVKKVWNKELIQGFCEAKLLVSRNNDKNADILEVSLVSIEKLMKLVESNIQEECNN